MPTVLSPVRFGAFEVDLRSGELRKNGMRVRLADQPLQVLTLLLEHPGEIVTREELHQRLWSSDTFVDFEHGLNAAVKRLREALGDSADHPQFIETLPRHGYRFIAPLDTPSEAKPRNRSRRWAAVPAAIVVLLAIWAVWFARTHRPPVLTEKDTVVLGDFTNTTGDPVFTDSLRQGLLVQLQQSPFLNILSDDKVQMTLREMERSPQEPLTDAVAREVCQRTQSKVLIAGSIAGMGSHYVLALKAVNCSTGDVAVQEQAQVSKKEDVLDALSKQGSQLRRKLGESLASIQKFDVPIYEATTSSLEALRAFSVGAKKMRQRSSQEAIAPFIRAMQLDRNFALAYAYLGAAYWNTQQYSLAEKNAAKAYELSAKVTDRERLYIESLYYSVVPGNLEKEIQILELWKTTYPQDYVPNNFLGLDYLLLGQYEQSVEEYREGIRKAPNVNVMMYRTLALVYLKLGQTEEAGKVLEDAKKRGLTAENFLVQSYLVALATHDAAEMERVAKSKSVSIPEQELRLLNVQASTEASYGRLHRSRELHRQAAELARREGFTETVGYYLAGRAVQEATFGNVAEARSDANAALSLSRTRQVRARAALAYACSGKLQQAQTLADELAKEYPEDTILNIRDLPTVRAAIEINKNNPGQAVELLRLASSIELSSLDLPLQPVYTRGQAYLALHRGTEAAAEFQKILDHPGIVLNDPLGALAHLGMARARVLQGDTAKARSEYEQFLNLWKDADPDIPVVREAKTEYAKLKEPG